MVTFMTKLQLGETLRTTLLKLERVLLLVRLMFDLNALIKNKRTLNS